MVPRDLLSGIYSPPTVAASCNQRNILGLFCKPLTTSLTCLSASPFLSHILACSPFLRSPRPASPGLCTSCSPVTLLSPSLHGQCLLFSQVSARMSPPWRLLFLSPQYTAAQRSPPLWSQACFIFFFLFMELFTIASLSSCQKSDRMCVAVRGPGCSPPSPHHWNTPQRAQTE